VTLLGLHLKLIARPRFAAQFMCARADFLQVRELEPLASRGIQDLQGQIDDLDEEFAGNETLNPGGVEVCEGFGSGSFLPRFALAF
jgi:hypothetical protein